MRVLCTVSISTRHDKGIHQTQKPSKATISIFQKNGEPFIQYFTEKSKKQGEKYRLKDNIFQCRSKFVGEGKLTIELKEPGLNIMISKADPGQLRQLMVGLKAAFKGETLLGQGILSSSNKPMKIGRTLKITINNRNDYKTKLSKEKGFPVELQEFAVNGLGMKNIDARLFKLQHLVKLDMTRNALSLIPKKIFNLRLKVLILAHNQLNRQSFPKYIKDSNLASSLEKLDLSQNKFMQVPGAIVRFKKIHTLLLDTNEIIRLPTYLPKTLKILSARNNKIEFTELPRFHFFEKLELEGNPFGMKVANVISIPVKQAVSSLIQMAAQTYLENGFVYNNKMLPWNVCEMLDTARYCPCFKPIWQRRYIFLAEYNVQTYCKTPTAPRGTDFGIPQIEFCCSAKCFTTFSEKLAIKEPKPEEEMQVEPAE